MTKLITLNPFNQNQRRLFQFGIVFLLLIFFAILFLLWSRNSSNIVSGVILHDSELQVFDQVYDRFDYPDRISIHYPYLLIIQPEKTLTTVYDLDKRKGKEKFKQVLLDYDGKNMVYNGKDTFFNNIDLGVLCSSAFIKSDEEILCVTNINTYIAQYGIMSIDPQSKLQRIIYQTNNLITSVTMIKGKQYIGEIDTKTNENFLTVDGNKINVPSPINLIYPMNNQIYVASFKSVFTSNKNYYYLIQDGQVIIQSRDKAVVLGD
ncbi:hypothetical protein COT62_02250 [Candidatus Roizmanbacteria bacterium CG09_land_8_20_14_0_10_41_9]|uniref:Uncharacterized protein n=1 Tax=Candidatus Roizmanbacteria bacterium CG09_land_8_20_14_0_10_41_9 TaxID=1974850 RepID=A0A2H0WSS3_9BACT|nr:MAG: hypothetical protein COT62_02250 [Candidatus Roizmanbacteria bacterium CG09_land_8_20_14_0_10_41_9]